MILFLNILYKSLNNQVEDTRVKADQGDIKIFYQILKILFLLECEQASGFMGRIDDVNYHLI